jgi:hypothetical protein
VGKFSWSVVTGGWYKACRRGSTRPRPQEPLKSRSEANWTNCRQYTGLTLLLQLFCWVYRDRALIARTWWQFLGRTKQSPGLHVAITAAWMPQVEPLTRNQVRSAPNAAAASCCAFSRGASDWGSLENSELSCLKTWGRRGVALENMLAHNKLGGRAVQPWGGGEGVFGWSTGS